MVVRVKINDEHLPYLQDKGRGKYLIIGYHASIDG